MGRVAAAPGRPLDGCPPGVSASSLLSPPDEGGTLSFVITGRLLVAFRPAEQHWWEYLNKIEEAMEVALAADLDLLPALMLRSRRLTSPSAPDTAQH